MVAVEAIMRGLAQRLGEDVELWGLVGLLHDVDYEKTVNSFLEHGLTSARMLEGLLPLEALDAIKAHNELTGYRSDTKLAKALKAADQLSGLLVAVALVMPSRKLAEVRVESILKKFKQKDFARGVDRSKIRICEELGLSLEEFIELGLRAVQRVSNELGL